MWAIAGLAACCCSAAAGEQSILFDFGAAGQRAYGNWNNITTPFDTGVLIEQAIDSTGRPTAVRLRQLDGWGGVNIKGHYGEGPYPSWAMRDSFFLSAGVDERARLRIEGLDPQGQYALALYASRMSDTNHRTGVYRIGSRQSSLNAFNNRTEVARFDAVAPDGDGGITLEVAPLDARHHAYLGVLEIRGAFGDADPALRPVESLADPPLVSARAWAVADAKTGKLVRGFRDNTPRPIASLTKIMAALVVCELAQEDPALWTELATVSTEASRLGGTTAGLQSGDRLLVRELLYGMLLPSGNDAAQCLAEHCGRRLIEAPRPHASEHSAQSETDAAAFISHMNERARRLGMMSAAYLDPHGNGMNRGSVSDLLLVAREALKHPEFAKAIATRAFRAEVANADGSARSIEWRNTNRLLEIEGYDGMKTGTTEEAGACLIASSRRGDDHLLVVVMGCPSDELRYLDARNLFRWAWQRRGHRSP